MIERIIHFCNVRHHAGAVPQALTVTQQAAIDRAAELHPGWAIKIWQDPINPAEFVLSKFWSQVNSGAQRADLVRIEAVHNCGGVYLDTDVLLEKPLDTLVDRYRFFIASEDGKKATNAVFGATRGHDALATMIRQLATHPPDWSVPPNETTGPEYFGRMLKWRSDVSMLPRESFYPYNWNEEPRGSHPQTYGVHLWEQSWKQRRWSRVMRDKLSRAHPSRIVAALRKNVAAARRSEIVIRCSRQVVDSYSPTGDVVRATVHGHRLVLDGSDARTTPQVVRDGYYDLREELFLRRILKGGDFFVDVGADVGVFSMLAGSLVGPFGRVFAYEANPRSANLLAKSATMNSMHERIVLRRAAAWHDPARVGDASLERSGFDSTAFASAPKCPERLGAAQRPAVALDNEFPCDLPIKCMKVRANGCEAQVIAGATRLLENRCVDYVVLPASPEASRDGWLTEQQSMKRLYSLGYAPFIIGWGGALAPRSLKQVGGQLRHSTVVFAAQWTSHGRGEGV